MDDILKEVNTLKEAKKIIADLYENKECKNVGIFIDFDNVYYGLGDYALNLKTGDYNVFELMNNIYGKDQIRTMRSYADYDQVDIPFILMQKQRVQIRNVYGNGKREHNRKNASDIELCIDAIESTYSNDNIDTYVFVTADSDMIPIMSRMIYKGKKVHLYCITENASQDQGMKNFAICMEIY